MGVRLLVPRGHDLMVRKMIILGNLVVKNASSFTSGCQLLTQLLMTEKPTPMSTQPVLLWNEGAWKDLHHWKSSVVADEEMCLGKNILHFGCDKRSSAPMMCDLGDGAWLNHCSIKSLGKRYDDGGLSGLILFVGSGARSAMELESGP